MSSTGKILITGATGGYGNALIQNLLANKADVRAIVHHESKSQGLRDAGVEVFIDFLKPETLDAAFDGADKVFLYTPVSPDAAKMASNCIAAAKRAGKPHIVRMSEKSPEPVNTLRVGVMHAQVNAELEGSGLPFTSLRPTFYMQNIMAAAQTVASDGMIYMPFKDAKLGMVDIRDVVEAGAKALTTQGHTGQTYVLTGPAAISFYDVASGLSKALGKEVKYVNVPIEAALQSMIGMGMPKWLAEVYCEYFANHSAGVSNFTTNDVEKLTGHPARSFETFARDYAQVFGKSG